MDVAQMHLHRRDRHRGERVAQGVGSCLLYTSSGEGGWERELYAFETIAILAWTQENEALKEEAARRAESILASQTEDCLLYTSRSPAQWGGRTLCAS